MHKTKKRKVDQRQSLPVSHSTSQAATANILTFSSLIFEMALEGLDNFSAIVNTLTTVDLSLRFGSQFVRNVAPVRQVVFSDNESRQLIDLIAQRIRKSEDLLAQDNGIGEMEMSSCRAKLSGYHLSLVDEENLLDSTNNPRIEHFRKTEKLLTNFDREAQRKRLELLSGCTERFYVEVLSLSKRAREKHEPAQKCGKFEDEDEIPISRSTSAFSTIKSWFQTKFSYEATLPDIEANGTIGLPGSGRYESSTIPHQGSHELNVDAVHTDDQVPEASDDMQTPCHFSITIRRPGVDYIISDPRIKTLADVKVFCSPGSISAIYSVAAGLTKGNIMPRGNYRFPYNSHSGTYGIPEETMADLGVD